MTNIELTNQFHDLFDRMRINGNQIIGGKVLRTPETYEIIPNLLLNGISGVQISAMYKHLKNRFEGYMGTDSTYFVVVRDVFDLQTKYGKILAEMERHYNRLQNESNPNADVIKRILAKEKPQIPQHPNRLKYLAIGTDFLPIMNPTKEIIVKDAKGNNQKVNERLMNFHGLEIIEKIYVTFGDSDFRDVFDLLCTDFHGYGYEFKTGNLFELKMKVEEGKWVKDKIFKGKFTGHKTQEKFMQSFFHESWQCHVKLSKPMDFDILEVKFEGILGEILTRTMFA